MPSRYTDDDDGEDPFERSTLRFTYVAASDRRRYHEAFEQAEAEFRQLNPAEPAYSQALARVQTAETEWLCADQIIDSPEYEHHARTVALRRDRERWVATTTRAATAQYQDDANVGVRVPLRSLPNYKNVHRNGLPLRHGDLVAVALPDEEGMTVLGRFLAYADAERLRHSLVLLGPLTSREVLTRSLFVFDY